jgi:hypothetical protein
MCLSPKSNFGFKIIYKWIIKAKFKYSQQLKKIRKISNQLHMKVKIDLYSIEVFTSAFAHYILIRLQKYEKENKKKTNKKSYTRPSYTWSSPSSSLFFTCNQETLKKLFVMVKMLVWPRVNHFFWNLFYQDPKTSSGLEQLGHANN